MVELDFNRALTVSRQDGELVLRINGSSRELLFFDMNQLPELTAEALARDDMETVKRDLISFGWDFLNNEFILGRLLAEAHTES